MISCIDVDTKNDISALIMYFVNEYMYEFVSCCQVNKRKHLL